ncbi:hypothetical protein, partial [Enterobacter hormaechei]|uniref:hypothetical protein n=1 Tax=Enterobacter hormaechei TaxID=158836 RepID=UPI00197D78F1
SNEELNSQSFKPDSPEIFRPKQSRNMELVNPLELSSSSKKEKKRTHRKSRNGSTKMPTNPQKSQSALEEEARQAEEASSTNLSCTRPLYRTKV